MLNPLLIFSLQTFIKFGIIEGLKSDNSDEIGLTKFKFSLPPPNRLAFNLSKNEKVITSLKPLVERHFLE